MSRSANDLANDFGRTGGQYSLVRAVFAIVVFAAMIGAIRSPDAAFSRASAAHDADVIWTGMAPPTLVFAPYAVPKNGYITTGIPGFIVVIVGGLVALMVVLGIRDRIMAILLALFYLRTAIFSDSVWWMFGPAPLLLAVAHLFVPAHPYGSWHARGRLDPKGTWTFPNRARWAFGIALALFMIATVDGRLRALDSTHFGPLGALNENYDRAPLPWYGGAHARFSCDLRRIVTAGTIVVDLLFVLVGLFLTPSRVRKYAWLTAVVAHAITIPYLGLGGMNAGFLLLFAFTFEPAWYACTKSKGVERVFYDGHCGLCHRAVRFVLSEDADGRLFRFSAMQGKTATETLPRFGALPDSIVILTDDGRVLVRSSAIFHMMRRLGGYWRLLGTLGMIVPRFIRDGVYDGIAKIRKRIFKSPSDLCPMMPQALRARFDP